MPQGWVPPVYLYRAGRERVFSRRYYNDVSTDDGQRRVLIKRTISGCGVLYIHEKRVLVPEGYAFVIERPGPYVYCFEDAPEPWEFEYLSISMNMQEHLLPEKMKTNPLIEIRAFPETDAMFTSLVGQRMVSGFEDDLLNSAAAYRLFLSLITLFMDAAAPVKSRAALALRQWLDKHFRAQVSIAAVAQHAGVTPEAATRAFRKEYGVTPLEYLNRLRIKHACRLLEEGDATLKRIANACGFSDANYFGRVFRKCVGVSPGEYRKAPDPLRLMTL